MTTVRVLLITAVLPEARALARAFHLVKTTSFLPLWLGNNIALVVVGVKAQQLTLLSRIPEIAAPKLIVLAGVAGALSPDLSKGDVVIDCREPHLPPLLPVPPARPGRLHTASSIVATAQQKSRLFQQTGCDAVDMETETVRRFAADAGIPFLVIRGISDTANEPLDPSLLALVDAAGTPRMARAITMLLTHPWKLPVMLRIRYATNTAMASVVKTIEPLIASGWPSLAADRRGNT